MSDTGKKPFLKFRTKEDHYTADACVVWCYDDRFYGVLKKFGKKQRFGNIDLVKVAGGAKGLVAEGDAPSAEREFLIAQIKTSVRLHHAKRIVLMLHRDCGAYGGTKAFPDAAAEKERHAAHLKTAKEYVMREVPAVPVETYFADFDGLYIAG